MSLQAVRRLGLRSHRLVFGIGIACACWQAAAAQNTVNPSAALIQEFETRVADYVKLHKEAEATVPPLKKPTESQSKIARHEHKLRKAIVARRAGAGQGSIFTPEISAEFRRLVAMAYHADAAHIRQSLQSSEPGTATVRIRVNEKYPDGVPLQTMPPSLLLNLPTLPPELEYRLVGGDLILRDIGANLIVDALRAVIPQ